MAVTTKIIVQQILNIDDTKATASKFPRYTVTLGNSISSITASELVSSIEAAAKSAAAAKDSEIAAKTSELNAKNSEQEAAISAGASEASATQSTTSATQSAASADRSAESAAAAKVSETNAKASETKAKTSETNAKVSETNAKTSETKAKASETNAKTSETNAAASAAAAKISETNAKISETNAAESATEAGKQATSAANSANNAKTEADRSKTEADRAKTEADRSEAAINNTPEIQPLPDVWIPFNDSLDMLAGFAPGYKQITVGDDVVNMVSDKVVDFKRASGATYINKSGVLTVAEVDEPRFEKEGLLIEGQRTNYFIHSNTPESWNPNPGLSRSETKVDDRGFKYATFTPGEYLGGAGTYTVIAHLTPNKIEVVKNNTITISFRAKGNNVRFAARFDKGDPLTSVAAAFIDSSTLAISTSGVDMANIIVKNVVRDGEWIAIEIVYKVTDESTSIRGVIQMVNKSGANFDDTSFMELTTPQVELGSCASSFIITEGTPATRASDLATIPIKNNLYNAPISCLVEVNKNWDVAPNLAPRIFDISGFKTADDALVFGFRSATGNGRPYVQFGSIVSFPAVDSERKLIAGFVRNTEGNFKVVSNGIFSTQTKSSWSSVNGAHTIRIGYNLANGERSLFGHIRNFRIWHKALTDRQMKESI